MKTLVTYHKALCDETRLRILALLSEQELCVCNLIAVLGLPQSSVSRHLAVLRTAGLVEDRRNGTWMWYRLAPVWHDQHATFLAHLLRDLQEQVQVQCDRALLLQLVPSEKNDAACAVQNFCTGDQL